MLPYIFWACGSYVSYNAIDYAVGKVPEEPTTDAELRSIGASYVLAALHEQWYVSFITRVNAFSILYTQNAAQDVLSCGTSVFDLARDMYNEIIDPNDIQQIKVVAEYTSTSSRVLWTLDHRRLYAIRLANGEGKRGQKKRFFVPSKFFPCIIWYKMSTFGRRRTN